MVLLFARAVLFVVVVSTSIGQPYNDYSYEPDFLDMDPDSILEENAVVTANATCGVNRREYYCRLVEHADGALLYTRHERWKRQVVTYQQQHRDQVPQSYRDPSGQWVQCSFCDARDPLLSHPIEYVLRGDPNMWWQSPSLAEGLKYHLVTITMDFSQVYQIVYVLLRMGDSPRPANWILERSLDGENYKPWVFFAESEYDCKRLYQPLMKEPLTVTSGPRPWKLEDDEVYCTTFYSQPQALESGEIIVTLSLDRASTISGSSGLERAISPKLIDFLSARYVRLRFQKLQTLSGDWMAMPNQLDSSVYNRYYYSIRTIKVGGKCLCNSHANRCEQRVIEGVPRAVCVCQHNTCGNNCESCCPMFNQQLWRPGRICEECNCHGKADSCVFNQTVANLRLSKRRDGVLEGGGVCVNCREDTTGINCESCKPGFYRPANVRPDSSFPCVKCECDTHGSTGECVSNDAQIPERYPGDCVCKEGFSGKRCDQCAEGFQRSPRDPSKCVPCTCDVRGSHRGAAYNCKPPCNCKSKVNVDSHCQTCLPGHFYLDADNPDGCYACYCSGRTNQCDGVSPVTAMTLNQHGLLGTVSNLNRWKIVIPSASADGGYPIPHRDSDIGSEEIPLSLDIRTVESWLSSTSLIPIDRGYYWSAPGDYLGKQITAYRSQLIVILRFNSPTMTNVFGVAPADGFRHAVSTPLAIRDQLDYMWLNEPDIVLEGSGYRLAYILPATHRDSHLIIELHLHESSFRVLVEPPSSVQVEKIPIGVSQGTVGQPSSFDDTDRVYQQAGRPATVVDMIATLSRLDRLLIKAKYIRDQTTVELRQVKLQRAERDFDGRIPSLEECVCPTGHVGTSCESCAVGYWRDPKQKIDPAEEIRIRGMWRDVGPVTLAKCVPCECNGNSNQCNEETGKCTNCQQHTAGDKCENCASGYYRNPIAGSSKTCKPCECPSLENQKTEACMAHRQALESDLKPYICLDCEDNTHGRYCEHCAPGYYGDPLRGIRCQKCDCGRGATGCNSTTGACICGFNTAGPRCDACAEGTHGDPLFGQACRPCNCHEKGSVSSTCRAGDGQCTCHPGYEGARCERCSLGRGNLEAGCPPCQCSPIGTRPDIRPLCDPITGQCTCKSGVGGTLDCSKCLPGYYNLGPHGCQECECSKHAVDLTCDPQTGHCKCGANVIGDKCEKCRSGHYWDKDGPDCLPCDCGLGTRPSGTLIQSVDCDMQTGQCTCADHVTGRQCTECESGYYSLSPDGCKPCPYCPNGYVCDKITGKCQCPPNTQGDRCEECSPGSWDYNPSVGCKVCNCSKVGTVTGTENDCDVTTGQCSCNPGFAGVACDKCETGFYGYPNCVPCECDARGNLRQNATIPTSTLCNQTDGSCYCKENVEGQRCDQCKPGTFGLNIDYGLGCYSCFCFPTTAPAKCSLLTGFRSVPGKEKGVEIIATDDESSPGGPLIQLDVGFGQAATSDLSIGVSQFSWRFSAHRPSYLEIPELKGSLTRNYGSVVVAVSTECLPTGECNLDAPVSDFPTDLIVYNASGNTDMAGSLIVRRPYRIDAKMTALNGMLHLEYQPADDVQTSAVDGFRQIWLRESDWVLTKVVGVDTRVRPRRNELMLALLNVTSFSVRLFMPEASPKLVSVKYRVFEALSETATAAGTQIRSIEKCDCPSTSSGDHCQIASSGFYFPELIPKPGHSVLPPKPDVPIPSTPENIVWTGGVEKCRCHGMSSHCNPITGICEFCTGNTVGPDCGECAVGYHGDPKKSQPCVKCQCPTEQTDYAITCYPALDRPYVSHRCVCKPGYTGVRCESCAPGYFGDPTTMTACQPCDCDMAGSKSGNCAQDTGQCTCWPGVLGRRCDQCEPDHVVDAGRCRDCRGECTGELFTKADEVKTRIDNLNITSLAYQGLARLGQQVDAARKRFSQERAQKETDLIKRTQKVAKQAAEVTENSAKARSTKQAIEITRCEIQASATDLRQSVDRLDHGIKQWIQRVQELPTTSPEQSVLQRWLEEARRVRSELSTINLNITQEWLDQVKLEVDKVIASAESLVESTKPGRALVDLERLSVYQKQQQNLLELQQAQLYGIGNSTQKASRELISAQTKTDSLKQAATEAADSATIQAFEASTDTLRSELDKVGEAAPQEIERHLTEAKTALKIITSIDLSDLSRIHVPPSLEGQSVLPLERQADAIVSTLRFSPKINQTMAALNSYQLIVDNMKKAREAAAAAESALNESAASGDESWQEMLDRVAKRGTEMEENLDQQSEDLQKHNNSVNLVLKQLTKAESDLDQIQKTADKTFSDSQEVVKRVSTVKQLLADSNPHALNASGMAESQAKQLRELRDRLQTVENRYAQLQGTAQSTVDQANGTQINFARLVADTETTMKQLDSKLLRLRRLAAEARSLLDVSYGSLAKDPIPIQLGRECVYSLVPYAVSKSRVFDIEFWFKLHSNQPLINSVLMVGRRAFAGRTQMFAFTLESSHTKLRFSWNVANGFLEIGDIATEVWYQVRVTSIAGETRMMLVERPNEDGPSQSVREVTTRAGSDYPEAALMLDRQMDIRVGGVVQPGSRLVNPEAWGDNGAEALWSRLLAMDASYFCIFNLRIGGVHTSLVDLATASSSCKQPSQMSCQLRFNYRSVARDGYIWRPQSKLNNLTTDPRPPQKIPPNYLLQRLFYYDFAGTGGYARIEQFKDLKFCRDQVQFQVTPMAEAQRNPMMVFTFFNFDKDVGVTVELVRGTPKATKWTGGQLYRSLHESDVLDASEAFKRRVLREMSYIRPKRQSMRANGEEKREVSITQSDMTIHLWRLNELLTTDCNDHVVMFLGSIPPGHYSIRQRMYELGLTLNPFLGRIGITNEKPSPDIGLYLEEYVNAPVARLGDTYFTDLQQRGEALEITNTKPDLQYCLRLLPDKSDTKLDVDEIQLATTKLGSPWEPGVSLTVRFDPSVQPAADISLLRLQMQSAEWLSLELTPDYRVVLVIPGAGTKLFTQESLIDRPTHDPAFALRDLEAAEARMINASLPAWKDTEWDPIPPNGGSAISNVGEIEVTITLHFSKADSKQVDVLFDQRIVQSWAIPSQATIGGIDQALVGRFTRFSQPITISYLVIGNHLVDFSRELITNENRMGVFVGPCGGQLYPRFLQRTGPVGPTWVEQGLDLAPPPGGRRLRFVEIGSNGEPSEDVSVPPKPPTDTRLRRKEDCTSNIKHSTWFDRSTSSYWEVNNLIRLISNENEPFEFVIGFRAQLSRGSSSMHQGSLSMSESTQYSVLSAFNFGPGQDNIYILLSSSQIFVTNSRRVLWSSPHLTILDSSWHQLELRTPENDITNESNGVGVETGVQMIFDGRHLWLPRVVKSRVPSLMFVGGLPSLLELSPDENIAPIGGLFGCIDNLEVNGIQLNSSNSGRPECYDCFSLDPNIVHVPASIQAYLKANPIMMDIPDVFLHSGIEQLTFDFSIFYDREKYNIVSLFVLAFEDEDNQKTHRLWLYVMNSEVKMAFVEHKQELTDFGHAASLLNLPRTKNTWHYIKLDILFVFDQVIFTLKSQVDQSLPLLLSQPAHRLKSIHFAQDTVVTPETTLDILQKNPSKPFSGCIRDLQLRTTSSKANIAFPQEVPDLLKGVCHTSEVW